MKNFLVTTQLITYLHKVCNILFLKKTIIILVIVVFSSATIYSQNTKFQAVDKFTLKTNISDLHRNKLRNYHRSLDTISNPVIRAKILNEIARTYAIASYYLKTPLYDSTYHYSHEALQLTNNKSSKEAVKQNLISLSRIGGAYVDFGYSSKGLEYFNKILASTETIDSPSYFFTAIQSSYTEIARIYAAQQNFESAIKQYESLFEYVEKKQIDTTKLSSIVYMYLASFHRETNNLSTALTYANKGVQIARTNKIPYRVAMAYLEIASIKLKMQEYDVVELYLSKAFDLLKNSEFTILLIKYYKIKSVLYDQYGNSSQKLLYAEKAFELLQNQRVTKEQIVIGQLLAEAYEETGAYKKAFGFLKKTTSLEKALSNNEEEKKSVLLEFQKKDSKIAFERNQKELEQANGKTKSIIISISLLFLTIAIIAVVFILKDRQKKIELAGLIKQKNKELKDLDHAKSRFFANISHELRTPLTLINGPIEQVLDETETQSLNPIIKQKLEMVRVNTDSLRTLINDILDLSKLK